MLVQETHGAEVEWMRLAEALRHSHRILHSTAGEFRQGGIAFFIKLDTFPEERFVHYLDVVIPGRTYDYNALRPENGDGVWRRADWARALASALPNT